MKIAVDIYTGIGDSAKTLALTHDLVIAIDNKITEDFHQNTKEFPNIISLQGSADFVSKGIRNSSITTLKVNHSNEDVIRYNETTWAPKLVENRLERV